jgi:hypothetical protein
MGHPIIAKSADHLVPAFSVWLSLYADDLIIFIVPTEQELQCVRAILDTFASASSLCSNIAKSQLTPIQCTEETIQFVQ